MRSGTKSSVACDWASWTLSTKRIFSVTIKANGPQRSNGVPKLKRVPDGSTRELQHSISNLVPMSAHFRRLWSDLRSPALFVFFLGEGETLEIVSEDMESVFNLFRMPPVWKNFIGNHGILGQCTGQSAVLGLHHVVALGSFFVVRVWRAALCGPVCFCSRLSPSSVLFLSRSAQRGLGQEPYRRVCSKVVFGDELLKSLSLSRVFTCTPLSPDFWLQRRVAFAASGHGIFYRSWST